MDLALLFLDIVLLNGGVVFSALGVVKTYHENSTGWPGFVGGGLLGAYIAIDHMPVTGG